MSEREGIAARPGRLPLAQALGATPAPGSEATAGEGTEALQGLAAALQGQALASKAAELAPVLATAGPPSSEPPSAELHVFGGAGGTAARLEDLGTAVRLLEEASLELVALAARLHGYVAVVGPSSALDPVGAARYETQLLGALDGPGGLHAAAAALGRRATMLHLTAMNYWVAERANQARMALLAHLDARVDAVRLLRELAGGEDPLQALEWYLTEHPGIVDRLLRDLTVAAAGLSHVLPLMFLPPGLSSQALDLYAQRATGHDWTPENLAEAASLLGLLFPDGHVHVKPLSLESMDSQKRDHETREWSMLWPPASFTDLLRGLWFRNEQAPGEIDVRVVERVLPDGSVQRAFIVDIPGTKSWALPPFPGGVNSQINDLGTNLEAMGGDPTAYQAGIAEALRRAGATPTDPVMLVGHSQGGMVAVRAAHDWATSGAFNVTHVITAGSPVGHMPVPEGVQVLSLENQHDIVPHLDARDNPDQPNRVTVTFSKQHESIGDNHDIEYSYLPAAGALDRSTDPSVQRFRASAGAFLGGGRLEVYRFQLTRVR